MNCEEIKIPVPWGTVAAKTWGSSSDPLILAIHGWTDNANSFDLLIPFLPKSFYYVCIDLPGHGKSSPLITSTILWDLDYIIVIKLIYDYFKRDKIIIIAHSLGGFITALFAQLYSDCVSKIVTLDVFCFYPAPARQQVRKLKGYFNQRLKYLSREITQDSEYTRDEIIDRVMFYRMAPLSRKNAEILVERNIEPTNNEKFKYTLSANVKQLVVTQLPVEDMVDILELYPIKCPHLVVLSTSSSHMRFALRKVINIYKKNPRFEYHIVDGSHEVHLDNPEDVGFLISNFLLKCVNKL